MTQFTIANIDPVNRSFDLNLGDTIQTVSVDDLQSYLGSSNRTIEYALTLVAQRLAASNMTVVNDVTDPYAVAAKIGGIKAMVEQSAFPY